jgi:hypothetical protein
MHWWLLETPLREKNPGSQFTPGLNEVGWPLLEPSGILCVRKIGNLHLTDPRR